MASNERVILNNVNKADMAISDLASGGLLNPEQSTSFLRMLHIAPTILNQMRVEPMNSPQKNIDRIGFGERILRKAVSGVALTKAQRSKPTTEQLQLNTKEVIAEVRLPYDVIEDNIEQAKINANSATNGSGVPTGKFKETIMAMIAERVAIDLEELAIKGDKSSDDGYLALLDGFLKQGSSNIVTSDDSHLTRSMVKNAIQTLPDAYKKNLSKLKNFIAMDSFTGYHESIAQRMTAGGDAINNEVTPTLWALGTKVVGAGVLTGANGMLIDPQNMIFGVQRKISIEVDKDITERVWIIVLTARVDFLLEEKDAMVRYVEH